MHKSKSSCKEQQKTMENPATKAGERLFLDMTGLFKQSSGGKQFDAKIINQFSRKTWSGHIKSKDQILELV